MKRRVGVVFNRLGPYHLARLQAATKYSDIVAIELIEECGEYAWEKLDIPSGLHHVCLMPSASKGRTHGLAVRIREFIDGMALDAVAVNGWSDRGALLLLGWCSRNGVPAILMSESNRFDAPRVPVKEWLKRHVLRYFSAALVGGTNARQYAVDLGMRPDSVFMGYDAVDNNHFWRDISAEDVHPSTKRYFLASSRFVEKKNLPRVLEAYSMYRLQCRRIGLDECLIWDLILLGDGAQKDTLVMLSEQLKVSSAVCFAGFKQYNELPKYYAEAGAFIHFSSTEQWGLVVNEAMASGLPVIVSNRCGCAVDLVREGINGWIVDPYDVGALADSMIKVSTMSDGQRRVMGCESQRVIADWGPDRFASGLKHAVECALRIGPRKPTYLDRIALSLMQRQ